ncbi:hypothetical protein KI688_006836 [Linnemannia hyalina]|uniref:Aldehyde dehydrogenase domain-containing protein n=1 Tax=Linnemannia hyalina TaxID=64524 RepID=A0A9P8BND3_9FUNG|nr:hypothetical protein KI688_006836 [Linnemannia hyalina]
MFTQDLPRVRNWINGQFVELAVSSPSSGTTQYLPVTSPYDAKIIGHVPLSSAADVAEAIAAARKAFPAWSGCTIKDRAGILIRFHALMTKHADLLSDMVVLEHGKTKSEALVSVSRGQDLVEYAMSLPHVSQTKILEVSRGITCYDSRVRNTMVLKPSEKVPYTMTKVVELLKEAGLPDGVVNLVNGTAEDHPDNHTVSAPDCDIEMTSTDVVESFSGCSGESCMAPSVLLTIGRQQDLIDKIVSKAEAIRPGRLDGQMGPVIDQVALDNITRYINGAEVSGARILVDGRRWTKERQEGYWVGPTVILHTNKQDALLHEELFGPVLSILEVATAEEAIAFENANPYGNGACIYTSSGATADFFIKRFNAGMCGIK